MKFGHICREFVFAAIQEFDRIGPDAMIKEHGGGRSLKWYIDFNGQLYDQKLIIRAAHAHAGGTFNLNFKAKESRMHLGKRLGFSVVKG